MIEEWFHMVFLGDRLMTVAVAMPVGETFDMAAKMAELRRELVRAVTLTDVNLIIQAMVDRAMDGSIAAARLVLQYAVGKPAESTATATQGMTSLQAVAAKPAWVREMFTAKAPSPGASADVECRESPTRSVDRPIATESAEAERRPDDGIARSEPPSGFMPRNERLDPECVRDPDR